MRIFSRFLVVFVLAVAFFTLMIASSSSSRSSSSSFSFVAALDEDFIRCKVCEKAIAHIWHEGDELRAHCKSDERNDHRCDMSNLHHFGIEDLTREVCKKLPKTHQAIEESEFDLVLHHDPQHPKEVADTLYSTCVKWVHHEHGLEHVARYMYANLDSGKHRDTILHSLQHKFCRNACNPRYVQRRKIESDHVTPNAADSKKDKEMNIDL